MHKALHPGDDVDKVYVSRKDELSTLKTALTHQYYDLKNTLKSVDKD